MWAKLHSVALIAAMILEAQANGGKEKIRTLERALKRTQALSERSVIKILIWNDEEADLRLSAVRGDDEMPVSQRVVAHPLGLHMIDLGPEEPLDAKFKIALENDPLVRAVPFTIYTVGFDGKDFTIKKTNGELAPKSKTAALEAASTKPV
jgi:hypothetical protein